MTNVLTVTNRRAVCVRWSWRALPTMLLLGIGLVIGLLTGVIPLCRLVLLGVVPVLGGGMIAATVILVLFWRTYPKPVRRAKSRPASMPRQFGVGPMMLLVTFYAIAFSMLRCLDAPPLSYAFVATFMAAVILGQIFLFHGKQPRKASVVAGLIVGCPTAMTVVYFLIARNASNPQWKDPAFVSLTIFYALLSFSLITAVAAGGAYLFGCVVSGIFLVQHRLHTGSWTLPAEEPTEEGQPHPPADTNSSASRRAGPGHRQLVRGLAAAVVAIPLVYGLGCYCRQAWEFMERWEALAGIKDAGGDVPEVFPSNPPKDEKYRTSISEQAIWLERVFGKVSVVILSNRTMDAFREGKLSSDCLAALCPLRWLSLVNATWSDEADLAPLRRLSGVELHVFRSTKITNAEINHLRQLRFSQVFLHLTGTCVRQPTFESLEDFPIPLFLELSGGRLTDADLEHIGRIYQLKELHLFEVTVADSGLKHLKRCSGLRELWLYGTKLSPAAIQELANALPQCTIIDPNGRRVWPEPMSDE